MRRTAQRSVVGRRDKVEQQLEHGGLAGGVLALGQQGREEVGVAGQAAGEPDDGGGGVCAGEEGAVERRGRGDADVGGVGGVGGVVEHEQAGEGAVAQGDGGGVAAEPGAVVDEADARVGGPAHQEGEAVGGGLADAEAHEQVDAAAAVGVQDAAVGGRGVAREVAQLQVVLQGRRPVAVQVAADRVGRVRVRERDSSDGVALQLDQQQSPARLVRASQPHQVSAGHDARFNEGAEHCRPLERVWTDALLRWHLV